MRTVARMWVAQQESRADIVDRCQRTWRHSRASDRRTRLCPLVASASRQAVQRVSSTAGEMRQV